MNYRVTHSPIGIERTHGAATPGSNVYGTLPIARANLAAWIAPRVDELKSVRKEWLRKPERDLPNDEPPIEQPSARGGPTAPFAREPAGDGAPPAPSPAGESMAVEVWLLRGDAVPENQPVTDAGGARPAHLGRERSGK